MREAPSVGPLEALEDLDHDLYAVLVVVGPQPHVQSEQLHHHVQQIEQLHYNVVYDQHIPVSSAAHWEENFGQKASQLRPENKSFINSDKISTTKNLILRHVQ